jgi:hypothetical protein
MFAEQIIVEPVFPSITALIAKLKQRLTPEQVAEQRFLNTGAVFFTEGTEGEPVRVEPVARAGEQMIGAIYQVGDEEVYIEKILDTTSHDGAAYLIKDRTNPTGTKIYVAGDYGLNDKAPGGMTFERDIASQRTGYIESSEGRFVNYSYELVRENTGEVWPQMPLRKPLSPRDAAIAYCFIKTGYSESNLKKGYAVIKPLYPVVDLDTPDTPHPTGEAKQPHPV